MSKSRFQAGLQCHKRLWLECYRRDLADPTDDAREAIFALGHRMGELARRRFPGGVLVAEDHTQVQAALETTARLLASGATCLFEAALRFDGVLVRPDVLALREDGLWDLFEVKSSTGVKPEHLTDAAVQTHVARGAGLRIAGTHILHVDNSYVYPGGEHDLRQLFRSVEVTVEVEGFLPRVPALLAEMKGMLQGVCPDRAIGRHCTSPYDCGFIGHCHSFLPDFPVTEIPRLSADVLDRLLTAGIHGMGDVPLDFDGLSPHQRAVCEAVRCGQARFAPELAARLEALIPPIHFLDFETFAPALPVYPGTRPYQVLPVQWSCHCLRSDGSVSHAEFLHEEASDPRRPFVESMLETLEGDGPIVVYGDFEATRLAALAIELPDRASRIERLRGRLIDLQKLVQAHVHHPDFHGRTSLKYVLPALVDDVSYRHLAIANGAVATLRYERAVADGMPAGERRQVFADLRAYCATDTLGLLRLYERLRECCAEAT